MQNPISEIFERPLHIKMSYKNDVFYLKKSPTINFTPSGKSFQTQIHFNAKGGYCLLK